MSRLAWPSALLRVLKRRALSRARACGGRCSPFSTTSPPSASPPTRRLQSTNFNLHRPWRHGQDHDLAGGHMPLDPVIQALFQEWPQLATRPVWEKTPAEARALFKQFCQFADPKVVAIGKSEDIKMPGPAGPLGLRIY